MNKYDVLEKTLDNKAKDCVWLSDKEQVCGLGTVEAYYITPRKILDHPLIL